MHMAPIVELWNVFGKFMTQISVDDYQSHANLWGDLGVHHID